MALGFREARRVRQPLPHQGRHVVGCCRELTGLGVGTRLLIGAVCEFGERLAALLEDLQDVGSKLFWI